MKCNQSPICIIMISIVLLFLNSACNPNKTVPENDVSYIWLDSLLTEDVIAKNLDKCRFVKLQTTDDCLIKWIQKIEFDDHKIFIQDTNGGIFVFDEKGKFLNTIGKIGPGPDEQLNVFDFYIDKSSAIVNVVDLFKSTLFKYSYSGKLLDKEKFDNALFQNTATITAIDDRYLLLMLDNNNASIYNYGILDNIKKKRDNYLPYLATGYESVRFGISKVAKSKKTTYMCAFMSDTIYKYDTHLNSIVPELVFKGKLAPATKKDVGSKTYNLALEAITTAKSKHLSTGIDQLYATDKYIHFTFGWKDNYYRVFFDTNSKSGCYSQIILTAGPYKSLANLITTTNEAFVCFIPAYEALSENLDGNPNLKEVLDITIEDDNPILVFYYLD